MFSRHSGGADMGCIGSTWHVSLRRRPSRHFDLSSYTSAKRRGGGYQHWSSHNRNKQGHCWSGGRQNSLSHRHTDADTNTDSDADTLKQFGGIVYCKRSCVNCWFFFLQMRSCERDLYIRKTFCMYRSLFVWKRPIHTKAYIYESLLVYWRSECSTYEWVMSHVKTSQVTRMNE